MNATELIEAAEVVEGFNSTDALGNLTEIVENFNQAEVIENSNAVVDNAS